MLITQNYTRWGINIDEILLDFIPDSLWTF